jgi:hypothetical protein
MSLPEEAGKVAVSTLNSLKGQPLMILVLVLNVLFLGVVYLGVSQNREFQAKEFAAVLERCTK